MHIYIHHISYTGTHMYMHIYIYVYLGILSRPLTVCNYHHPNYHILSRGPYQLSLSTVTGRGSIPIYKRLQGFINISSIYWFSILFKSLFKFPLKILKGRWVYIAFSQKNTLPLRLLRISVQLSVIIGPTLVLRHNSSHEGFGIRNHLPSVELT